MIARLKNATLYSLCGLRAAVKDEPAFQLECIIAMLAVPLACFLRVSPAERALMIGSVFLVLAIELINTSIEAIVDLASPQIHPLAKKAKDAGSAAVLISCISVGIIWAVILLG